MPPSKRMYEQFVEDSEAGRPLSTPVDPLLHAAAVKSELLTQDSKWDTFLSQLQAAREQDLKELTYFVEKLKTAYGEQVVLCQINIAGREACIKRMDDIMTLPSRIVRAAHESGTRHSGTTPE